MEARSSRSGVRLLVRSRLAVLCVALLVQGNSACHGPQSEKVAGSAQSATTPAVQQSVATPSDQQSAPIPADQLDALVAPIALYPDPLLSQVLVASTYPLEIIQLQQWLERNKNLKDQALVDAVAKQPWDPSIQAMAALPDVVKRLADDIQWTTDLGNTFLAQQSDVMDAVQRMRQKAQGTGALKSNEQQKVETKVVENKTVIVVEQANPEVVYVPSYNPTVVYGAPVYPYPAIYYPPSTGEVIAATAISFGVGVALGAAWGGGWGWGCGWGDNDIDINVNNNFNRNTNINNVSGNRVGNTSNKWQHNPQHRGGAPYANRGTADRFGGPARGDSLAKRQSGASQQLNRQGGNLGSTRGGSKGLGDRGGISDRASGTRVGSDRASGTRVGDRAGGSGRSSLGTSRGGGGGDRVGGYDIQRTSGGRSAFGGDGFNGGSARASSTRGASSTGGGGGMRGGGGGGGRGGGRRR